ARTTAQAAHQTHHRAERGGGDAQQDQRIPQMPEAHGAPAPEASLTVCFQSSPSPSSGGRYSLEWLTMRRLDSKTPAEDQVPSTTTPMLSRNIWGGVSRLRTVTLTAPSSTPSATRKTSSAESASHSMLPSSTTPPRRMVGP